MEGMLGVLNLYVIEKIFNEESEIKLTAMSQMIYINCLMHHFKNKPANVSSAIAFEILEEDFKNFHKYSNNIKELSDAGLITRGIKSIVFNNVWGKHIDKSKLDKVNVQEYVAGFQFQSVTSFKEELLNSRKLIELAQMKYKIANSQINKLIELFVVEQETFEKKYSNFSDCIKHCIYWMATNSEKVSKEVVKSNAKILGG